MPSAFTTDDYVDLVTTTLKNMERGTYADISKSLRNHPFLEMILKKEHVTFSRGQAAQFNVKVGRASSARWVKLNEAITPRIYDYMKTVSVPWRHVNTHWAVEERAIEMNMGEPEQLVDLIQVNRSSAYEDLADEIEAAAWSAPSSSSDEILPYGIAYWIVKASGDPSFQGGAPSGFSDVAGLSPTTYPNWKNWTGQYTAVTKGDLVKKLKKACRYTKFKSAYPKYSKEGVKGDPSLALFTTYSVKDQHEDLVQGQNDNLGKDTAAYADATYFKRAPLVDVDYLTENASDNPVYGLNFKWWTIRFLKGEYLKEGKPTPRQDQHRTLQTHVDATLNIICRNRREAGFVLYV
jgi:hypothetical protein